MKIKLPQLPLLFFLRSLAFDKKRGGAEGRSIVTAQIPKLGLILGIILLSCPSSLAQSPEKLEYWVRSVEAEYPGIDQPDRYNEIKSSNLDFDRICYNLMADKYFVPLMGQRFDELSSVRREKFVQSVHKFLEKEKRKLQPYSWSSRLADYMFCNFTSSTDYIARRTATLRETRQEFAKIMARLNSGLQTQEEVTSLLRPIGNKFDRLLLSEIRALGAAIVNLRDQLADKQIKTQLDQITKSFKRFELLENLSRLQMSIKNGLDHENIVRYLAEESKAKLLAMLEEKCNAESTQILEQASQLIKIGNLDKANQKAWEIMRKEEALSSKDRLAEYFELLSEFKIKYIRDHQEQIKTELKSSEDLESLEGIAYKYFSGIKGEISPQLESLIRLKAELHDKFLASIEASKKKQERELLQAENKAITASGLKFNSEGLANPELARDIMKGDFLNIRFSREDPITADIIYEYITAYGQRCRDFLPKNKVQLFEDVCVKKEVKVFRNHLGFETNRVSRCVSWEKRPTGIYTSPELNKARLVVNGLVNEHIPTDMFNELLYMRRNGAENSLNDAVATLKAQVADKKDPDMFILVKRNGCNSAGLRRFEENLIRFAMDQPPIQLMKNAEVSYAIDEVNFSYLIEDLILQETDNWFMKIYERNSVVNVNILEKDERGRPIKILADYSYIVSGHKSQSQVVLELKEGLPKCLYFDEKYFNCRPADKNIIADFINGRYKIKKGS